MRDHNRERDLKPFLVSITIRATRTQATAPLPIPAYLYPPSRKKPWKKVGRKKRGLGNRVSSHGCIFSPAACQRICAMFSQGNTVFLFHSFSLCVSQLDCSVNWNPLGKHAIHEVNNISFSHLSCDSQAAVVVHWMASPLGGFIIDVFVGETIADFCPCGVRFGQRFLFVHWKRVSKWCSLRSCSATHWIKVIFNVQIYIFLFVDKQWVVFKLPKLSSIHHMIHLRFIHLLIV